MPVALEQSEDLDGVDPACDGGRGVAVGGEEPVALGERERGACLAGLLPVGGGVDGEFALADQRTGLVVDAAADHQGLVRGEQPVRVWERQDRVFDRAPRGFEQLYGLLGGQQVLVVGHATTSVCRG